LIEQTKVKFESVTNNLGRTLLLTRQNDKVGNKLLIAVGKDDRPNACLEYSINKIADILDFNQNFILYLTQEELN